MKMCVCQKDLDDCKYKTFKEMEDWKYQMLLEVDDEERALCIERCPLYLCICGYLEMLIGIFLMF